MSTHYEYIREGIVGAPQIVLLHGLFGVISNWETTIRNLNSNYDVFVPLIPLDYFPKQKCNVDGVLEWVEEFINDLGIHPDVMIGNSLGGHVALMYSLKHNLKGLVLTGSSGIFEQQNHNVAFRRHDKTFITKLIRQTFHDGSIISQDYIDDIYDVLQDNAKVLRLLLIAKSSQRVSLQEELPKITIPTLLIWGKNDTITPPGVGQMFNKLLPNSKLFLIDECAHVPMMEHPEYFNTLLNDFLNDLL